MGLLLRYKRLPRLGNGLRRASVAEKAVFNTSPESKESGISQNNTGPAAAESGNIFVVTGNGKFDKTSGPDYGDIILKIPLDDGRLLVHDYFTPHDEATLSKNDEDQGPCRAGRNARRCSQPAADE